MNNTWPSRRLCDIAAIRISNVDKKTRAGEKPVRLCNYMDVYSNDYITGRLDFMEATASEAEIERFSLDCGDVVITKDSETPDDIGIPAVIADKIEHLVCGYHLALIRPAADHLDSVYLAKQLSTSRVARYFARQASGSTRYGLPISTIESLSIPTPPKPEQSKIAEILLTVDRVIGRLKALIAKQQRIKTGLMNELLTRGIDGQGKLRTEDTYKYKDSPLGRIPSEWELHPLSSLADVNRGKFTHRPRNDPQFYGGEYPFIQTGDVTSRVGRTIVAHNQTLNKRGTTVSKEFPIGTIAITIAANIADTAILAVPMYFPDSVVGAVVASPNNTRFVELMLRRWKPILERLAPQSAQKNINLETLKPLRIPTPSPSEQERIGVLYDKVDSNHEKLEEQLAKLCFLKTALMQDLLTGKRRVTALLEPEPARERIYARR